MMIPDLGLWTLDCRASIKNLIIKGLDLPSPAFEASGFHRQIT